MQHIYHEVIADACLEQPVLGRPLDVEPCVLPAWWRPPSRCRVRRRRSPRRGRVRDRRTPTARSCRPARNRGPARAGPTPLRLSASRRCIVSCGHVSPDRRGNISRVFGVPMRMATFNILHGRRRHNDGVVHRDRLVDAGSGNSIPTYSRCRRCRPRSLPRSGMADLTAVAGGPPWRRKATGSSPRSRVRLVRHGWQRPVAEQPGTAAYGIALLSRFPVDDLAGRPAPAGSQ